MLTLKQMLTTDWHVMRLFRLAAGLFIGFQAWQDGSWLIGLLAGIFIVQALTNSGCCGATGCSTPNKDTNIEPDNEIQFTEIKAKRQTELTPDHVKL